MSHCCAICTAASRGFGWSNPCGHHEDNEEKEKSKRYRFCSMRCQDIHYQLLTKGRVVENTEKLRLEKIAAASVIDPLANYVCEIGADKTLFDYSKQEIHGLIHTVIDSYNQRLQQLFSDDIPF